MSFHDEPMVVENGPLGMDVGQKHADIPGLFGQVTGTNNWLRKASHPSRILVLVKRPNGDVEDYKLTDLDTDAGPVMFTLKVPGDTDEPTVNLEWGGVTRDELTIAPKGFSLQRNGVGRRLSPSRPARIVRIDWNVNSNTADFIDLRDGAGTVHESVFVAIL